MVQTVKIRKGEKTIRVHFMYNTDLVDIMQEHKGWFFRKERCWQFPLWKLQPIYDELTAKHYSVEITKLVEKPKKVDNQTLLEMNVWQDRDVVVVYGKCKKCGENVFINKDGLCTRCK